jgi:3-oxoacyl-[acyl-carrier protein] reductase
MIDFSQLQGKTVAITGASRGIGKETATLLGGLGANLVLGARDVRMLEEAAAGIETATLALPLDVANESSVKRFTEEALHRFGAVDVLINAAGTGTFSSILDLSVEAWDEMMNVNTRGTFLCCKYFGKMMVSRGAGTMINVVSVAGTTALPGCGGYSASKFGVLGLTRVLQAELRGKGIRVTALLPGAVHTSFWDRIENKPDTSLMIPVESLAKHIVYLLCQPGGSVIDEMTVMPPLGVL